MGKIIAIVVVSIFFSIMAAVVFGNHSGAHHGQPRDCLLSAISVAPCPQQTTTAVNLLFHLNAMKQFFLAATDLIPLVVVVLIAAAVVSAVAVYRRFWRSIYDAIFRIFENFVTQKMMLRLEAISLRHPPRAEFLKWLARSRAADDQKR